MIKFRSKGGKQDPADLAPDLLCSHICALPLMTVVKDIFSVLRMHLAHSAGSFADAPSV